jgi:tetratricopeptide (TPR) repeat protein
MNKTVKITTVLLWVLAFNVLAADSGYIILKSGKKLISSDISSDKNGNVFFLSDDGKLVIPVDMVDYVIVKKPSAILEAEQLFQKKQYDNAATSYGVLAKKYRFLGWYACALAGQVEALHQQNKNSEAEEIIKPLLSYKPGFIEREQPFMLKTYRVYAEILLKEKRYEALLTILYRLKRGSDGELSAWAFNIAGQQLLRQKKYREAAREFIQPVLLYDNKNRQRRKSLRLLVTSLAEFDKKLSNFYLKRLKKEYNDSTLSSYR